MIEIYWSNIYGHKDDSTMNIKMIGSHSIIESYRHQFNIKYQKIFYSNHKIFFKLSSS